MSIAGSLKRLTRYADGGTRKQRLTRKIREQSERSLAHGFLHIPKTGGSGIDDLFGRLSASGISCPVKFDHAWRFEEIIENYPDTRISIVLRDPLERMISGFQSRLRMGRPRNNSPWSVNEAVAFTYFANPREFFLALAGNDERDKSAALFGFESIQHIRLNYAYYFNSVETIKKYAASFEAIGMIENMDGFITQLAGLLGVDANDYLQRYQKAHVGGSDTLLKSFSLDELETVKNALANEYEIYNQLKSMVNC